MQKIIFILVVSLLITAIHAQNKTSQNISPKPVIAKTNSSAVAGKSQLNGIFSAPSGSSVIIQHNGKNDFTLSSVKEKNKLFSVNKFTLPSPAADGSPYKLSLKKIPAGQTCAIYSGAKGVMLQNDKRIRIGCDQSFDLVSRSTNDGTFSTFYESSDAAIGGAAGEEGRYICFVSSATGFNGASGKRRQIFWRDRNLGITKMISSGLNGEEGNGDCYYPAISGDGKSVAFESYSTNLVENDKNGFRDVFVWHAATSKIERASIGPGGREANAESYEPSLSMDGNLIAFTSAAGNISVNEKGVSDNNVFLRDLQSDLTIMISIDPNSRKGGGGSKASISADGSRITFYSHTATLVPDDKNGIWDIFLWEKNNPLLKRISLAMDGKERMQGSESANRIVAPAISGNGQFIAYTTTAGNMVADDNNNFQDVFVYDVKTGKTTIASNVMNGKPGNADSPIEQGEKIAISFDGTWVAFATRASNLGVPSANIVMHNMITGENRAVTNISGSSVGRPSISHSGSYIIFGIGGKLDSRFSSSGIFASYTGLGPSRFCPE